MHPFVHHKFIYYYHHYGIILLALLRLQLDQLLPSLYSPLLSLLFYLTVMGSQKLAGQGRNPEADNGVALVAQRLKVVRARIHGPLQCLPPPPPCAVSPSHRKAYTVPAGKPAGKPAPLQTCLHLSSKRAAALRHASCIRQLGHTAQQPSAQHNTVLPHIQHNVNQVTGKPANQRSSVQ